MLFEIGEESIELATWGRRIFPAVRDVGHGDHSSCSLRGPRDLRDLCLEYARDVSDKHMEVIVDLPPVPAVPRDFACENNKGHGEAPAGPSSPATLASIADRLRRVHEHHVPGSANIYDHRTAARRARCCGA